MSRNGEIELDWPDGTPRKFRLGLGELRTLQERLNAGPMAIARRLTNGNWLVDDVIETIRIAAVGGGATLEDAVRIKANIELRPLLESVKYAQAIILAALNGPDDEQSEEAGKSDAGKSRPTRTASGSSRTSTGTARSSAGRRSRSTPAASGN